MQEFEYGNPTGLRFIPPTDNLPRGPVHILEIDVFVFHPERFFFLHHAATGRVLHRSLRGNDRLAEQKFVVPYHFNTSKRTPFDCRVR